MAFSRAYAAWKRCGARLITGSFLAGLAFWCPLYLVRILFGEDAGVAVVASLVGAGAFFLTLSPLARWMRRVAPPATAVLAIAYGVWNLGFLLMVLGENLVGDWTGVSGILEQLPVILLVPGPWWVWFASPYNHTVLGVMAVTIPLAIACVIALFQVFQSSLRKYSPTAS